MKFVIGGLMYDTDRMKKVADVKKRYKTDNIFVRALHGTKDVGITYGCELWKSKKGNWLLTHNEYGSIMGEAIKEDEVRELLMRYATETYELEFEKIPEA